MARTHLTIAITSDEEELQPTHLKLAEKAAREALALDEAHIEGRLQLALALSLQTKSMSNSEAMESGYADTSKAIVKSVLKDHSDNHYAHGFLSVWNLEVLIRGGRLGGLVLGASVNQARKHYVASQAEGADDPAAHWQYGRGLIALNARRYQDEAEAVLTRSIELEPRTELERVMQTRARTLLQALRSEDAKSAQKLARKML